MSDRKSASTPWPSICLVVPAVLAAGWLLWAELIAGTIRPEPDADMPFVDALVADRFELAFRHIRAGQSPDAPIAYRDDAITAGRELMLTPLVIAIANGRIDTVKMLLSSGVTIEAAGNRFAVCLANQLGQTHIAETIVRQAGPATPAVCPPPADPGAPVLAAYVE